MRRIMLAGFACTVLIFSSNTVLSASITITFDELGAIPVHSTSETVKGVTFSVPRLDFTYGFSPGVPSNVSRALMGFTGVPLTMSFDQPVSALSFDLWNTNANPNTATVQLVDTGGTSLPTITVPLTGGSGTTFSHGSFDYTAPTGSLPVSEATLLVNSPPLTYYLENVTFTPISPAAVPEPASLVLGSTSALIGLGYWWCRRRRAVT